MRCLVAVLLLVSAARAQPALGETQFPNSGAPEAQEPFLQGLLLLHSFEYDDARLAFQHARRLDPGFAMAAWGEAMTHNHPVWQQQDRDAARAALAGVSTEGLTARERDYLASLDVLYGDGDKETRDDRYAEALRLLAADYPDDLDARSLYALALLGTAHEGRDVATYMQAAAVAEDVFAANPRHPGAAHYLIHAYDDPVHAPLGLRPARVYADIAPAASHALHMPSHIYFALGLWEEVRVMNQRSYDAAKRGTDARGDALNGHGWHALWWWHYAATQLGDPALADSLLAVAETHHAEAPTGPSMAHVVRIRAQHALGVDAPAAILSRPPPPDDAGVTTLAIDALARGLAMRSQGRDIQDEIAHLERAIDAAGEVPWAARAAALMLTAAHRTAEGDAESALALLQEAARLETDAPLTFGPPAPVQTANEALGIALLASCRADEAADAFRASLARQTHRRQSVDGLAAAGAPRDCP